MKIGIFSTMAGMPWGGSEELWSRTASVLMKRGHHVCVNYRRRKQMPAKLANLKAQSASIHLRSGFRLGRTAQRILSRLNLSRFALEHWLKTTAPEFVLVSVGYHTDDLAVAAACRKLGIPYSLLLQAASPHVWFDGKNWQEQHDAYAHARRCYFVSRQNRDIIESNLAIDMSAAHIVDNPFNLASDAHLPWPSARPAWKMACVARLQFQSKGQDLLIQALRRPKWRSRNFELTFFGEDGGNLSQLKKLVALYGLQGQIKFGGFVENVASIWNEHHALVLPSRFEGNALAMIEAMLCGRVPIVTNVGRVEELIDDNESGFVAQAATVDLVDDALERAWQRRDEWQAIGGLAAQAIRTRHSLRPAEDFADAIEAAAGNEQAPERHDEAAIRDASAEALTLVA